jgi:hypothetical protein
MKDDDNLQHVGTEKQHIGIGIDSFGMGGENQNILFPWAFSGMSHLAIDEMVLDSLRNPYPHHVLLTQQTATIILAKRSNNKKPTSDPVWIPDSTVCSNLAATVWIAIHFDYTVMQYLIDGPALKNH